jgi:hypothetical protein
VKRSTGGCNSIRILKKKSPYSHYRYKPAILVDLLSYIGELMLDLIRITPLMIHLVAICLKMREANFSPIVKVLDMVT